MFIHFAFICLLDWTDSGQRKVFLQLHLTVTPLFGAVMIATSLPISSVSTGNDAPLPLEPTAPLNVLS
jgi:hypothetical protein